MPVKKLMEILDNNKVKYIKISHSTAYTAQEAAAQSHVSGKEFAKAVLFKQNGKLIMAVLPASYHVNMDKLKIETGSMELRLAYEQEFIDKFPDCEPGAMPPFGNLYGLSIYADKSLSENDDIAFNACNHKEIIRMSYKDWEKLVQPKIMQFAIPNKT